jgi:hypothetical protein
MDDIDRPIQNTLASRLERDRIRHRAERLQRVLDRLHERVTDVHSSGLSVPAPLWQAILSFERQLAEDRGALDLRRVGSTDSYTSVRQAPAIS